MVSEEATECSPRELGGCTSCLRGESPTCSFEEVITLSDSLSLSSYSSWLLLPPPARWLTPVWKRPPRSRLFLLYRFESCWTVRPVVTISSVAEDREDEDGLELRSIQDSRATMLACGQSKGACMSNEEAFRSPSGRVRELFHSPPTF